MRTDEVKGTCESIIGEVGKVIVGKRAVMERCVMCLLADGHLLFEDYPGLAKTLLAKTLARATGMDFKRVQFTPDLLPADITGTYILDRQSSTFALREGPVFTNLLLADEINRAPPKTQSALLEAMQERQVTLEGATHPLPKPFIVMATQNPIEYEGTYPLPEAQIDRFLMRTEVGYPGTSEEAEVLRRRRERKQEDASVQAVSSAAQILEMQRAVEDIHVDPAIDEYIVKLVAGTRTHPQVEVGASPRGSLALMRLGAAHAALVGRDYLLPDDVKEIVVPALAHRLILAPDPWIRGVRPSSIIEDVLRSVPVPKVD
ncbi:MAG TPA: MoxR family ATPase [Methanomassiliicoccales archaeon]|nr:MoxR family ATPase [Methanomassiliicoccales archaeon]